jgi:FAD/FMN-containing dehydrogenase
MGLTGIILSARLRLIHKESAYFEVTCCRMRNLDEALERLAGSESTHRYSVAWLDCMANQRSLGRSVVMLANDAPLSRLPAALGVAPQLVQPTCLRDLPFYIPPLCLSPLAVKVFNALYYASHFDRHSLLDYDNFLYPLDRVSHWNRLYGRKGFVQYQAFFPLNVSRRALIELLQTVASSRRASFLAVLKSCGHATKGIMSYLSRGHTLALDFPNTGSDLPLFLRRLDDILIRHGGRIYLAKDAMTTADAIQAMYPALPHFLESRRQLDPQERFASSLSRRLGLSHPHKQPIERLAA